MKCEHCGKNEVTLIYRSNMNGTVTEKHLCHECAEALGVTAQLAKHHQRMMSGFDSYFGRSLFDDFFSPMPGLMSRMNRLLESPFDDLFAEMPALQTSEVRQEEPKKQEELVDDESRSRFARARELNALRLEMKQAAQKEEFERAAQLRDRIRELEAQQNDDKESA